MLTMTKNRGYFTLQEIRLYDDVFDACLAEDAAEAVHDDPDKVTILSGNELRIAREVRRLAVEAYLEYLATTVAAA